VCDVYNVSQNLEDHDKSLLKQHLHNIYMEKRN
jgi:hypothetical protein